MMEKNLDARGKACPMPVIMAKKEMDAGNLQFSIIVDNDIAVQNLRRLAESQGYNGSVHETGGIYTMDLLKKGAVETLSSQPPQEEIGETALQAQTHRPWALFLGKDTIGDGDKTLGESLARMFFYTLTQSEDLPRWIIFMNNGVKLPALDDQVAEHLKALQEKGCMILVCGTCLNFYGLKETLRIGTISNMYDITVCLQEADKVITL
jgi:selenium metabolism protein YedF